MKSWRRLGDLVAVADPDERIVRQAGEEIALVEDGELGPAVLVGLGADYLAAEHLRAELHAVADAEDRDAQVEDLLVASRGVGHVDAGGPAGEDDALERQLRQLGGGGARREDAGVDVVLADPAGDQLDVLAAEVQDGDHFTDHEKTSIERTSRT